MWCVWKNGCLKFDTSYVTQAGQEEAAPDAGGSKGGPLGRNQGKEETLSHLLLPPSDFWPLGSKGSGDGSAQIPSVVVGGSGIGGSNARSPPSLGGAGVHHRRFN